MIATSCAPNLNETLHTASAFSCDVIPIELSGCNWTYHSSHLNKLTILHSPVEDRPAGCLQSVYRCLFRFFFACELVHCGPLVQEEVGYGRRLSPFISGLLWRFLFVNASSEKKGFEFEYR
ncbi:hypothetical protein GWI33_020013 [Rhynchophorus ferrugineus]|uniref:Uncharacterized protein n=1 Tax=Rhynchophorus ferrugineus TaxID=354439 RepID=A0A834LZW6_RHYFE|nr:hypothetical protein GWI33_020013 [Rhynchophorus ferrugineus]